MWQPARLPARVRDQLARRQGDTRRGAGRVSPVQCGTARGAGPVGPLPWAQRTTYMPSEFTWHAWSTTETPRRPYTGMRRRRRVADSSGARDAGATPAPGACFISFSSFQKCETQISSIELGNLQK
jgi:hypothetical protein